MLATNFMKRRHLFDNGYPVCQQTLLTGAQVLLAIARQSLKRSHGKLASSFVDLADCAALMIGAEARLGSTRVELRAARAKCGTLFGDAQRTGTAARSEADHRVQPGDRAACEKPHSR